MARTRRRSTTKFNAVSEAERLYFSLLRKGEVTAAASILGRLMASTEAVVERPKSRLDVSNMTDEEFQVLGDLLRQMYFLQKRVAAIGLASC